MPSSLADIKSVRPFKKVSALTTSDENFGLWNQKAWTKLCIEVGCGVGMHPIRWAQQNPDSGLVALERTKEKFESFKGRLLSHDLKNIHAVNEDGLYWLPENIKTQMVDEYFFLYPNPYPKEDQANKRWHRSSLMHFILETLKPKGLIHFATNEPWLAEEGKNYFLNYWKLSLLEETSLLQVQGFQPRTHFEKKYLSRNESCKNFVFQKN
ncbi:MAG: hypothetical protein HRT44_02565 [Bdellovibrionales bacterium]|nr:tRNA (guanine-N(7)-)-methyltransferase [Bdellovibrionales bacterium]NQZ18130.1 hypothetical protein [Bdellovibrionales bacterium]